MKYTKKQMTGMLTAGAFAAFLLLKFYFEFPLALCLGITLLTEILFAVSFCFEKRSHKNYEKLREAIQSGEYENNSDWREKYLEFISTKGFERVKHSSMKTDMCMRYFRPYGLFMIFLGTSLLILNFIIVREISLMLFLIAVSAGLALYGLFRLSAPNVRRFIKKYGKEYSCINESYVSGKQLTFRKAISASSSEYYNDGINLGNEYVVIFNTKEIAAFKYSDIVKVKHRIQCTKYYGNGMYTGTVYSHYIDVSARDALSNSEKTFSARLSEFQAEYACETLNTQISVPELENSRRETYI